MSNIDKNLCIIGGILFVTGLVALQQGSFDAAIFLMGIGLVFMAVGLGRDYVEDLYESFKSVFEGIFNR